jgi:hypothetical protein
VAEAAATTTAARAIMSGACNGSWAPRKTIAPMSRSWEKTSQPRRWPSVRLSTGTWKASTIGAQRNFRV